MANDKKFIVKNGLTANTISLVDNAVSPTNTINIAMDGANDKLVISGDAGNLLTVTDANTGTLFEVANSSGSSVFSITDDGTIAGVDNFQKITIGSFRPSGAFPSAPINWSTYDVTSLEGISFSQTETPIISVNVASGDAYSLPGALIDLGLNLRYLTTSTADGDGDYFVVVDTSGNQKKLTKANINLSGFNNDAGFVTTDTNTTNFNIQANGGTQVNISAGEEINFINGNATTVSVTNQTNPTVQFNHADTSSQSSVNNSGRTYIQDVTLDAYGHVTGLVSATETVVNTDTNTTYSISAVDSGSNAIIRLTAGGSGSGTDDVTLVAGSNITLTPSGDNITIAATDTNTTYTAGAGIDLTGTVFSHTDTSTQASLTALTGANVISDIDVDTYGHVTNLATRTMTLANLGYTGATNADNYGGWGLIVEGITRGTISSGENVHFLGGTNVSIVYSATNNGITFNATDTNTTYAAGNGIKLTGTTFEVVAGVGLSQTADGLTISTNGIEATSLAVSGNGIAGQALLSDGDGTFSWGDAGSGVTVSATAPAGPSEGDLWWDEDVGNMFIYYNDGSSSQWVEASPNPKALVYNAATSTYTLTGNLTVTGDLNSNSDEKLKDNINTFEGGLEAVNALRGVRYDWKENGKSSIGLIAQEVEKVLPELVSEQDDIKSIQYGNIVAVLIEAVKELSAKVEELENK